MAAYLKNMINEMTEQKLVDDLTLDKLTTRKVNQLRQRENRAKILEKTRNISEAAIEDNKLNVEQTEDHIKQEINKFKRRSVKLNEFQRQNEENKMIKKIKSMTIINKKKSPEESKIESKPVFRVSKVSYDDKHLYQKQSSVGVVNNKIQK